MRLAASLVLCTACGRIAFDRLDSSDAGASDGDARDASSFVPQGLASSFSFPMAPGPIVNIPVPVSAAPGDLILLAMFLNQLNATVAPPSQWTTVFSMADTNQFRAGFFERRVASGDPTTYSFGVANSNLVAWALVVYRDQSTNRVTDTATLLAGAPATSSVTYTTPIVPSKSEVVLLFVDDSGTSTGEGTWSGPSGMVNVADADRVSILRGNLGAAMTSYNVRVDVPNTTVPHGAVWAVAW